MFINSLITTARPLIKIGVITSAHGVRGQVKIHTFLDNPESLFTYPFISDSTGKKMLTLKREGIKESLLIVSIDGVKDRNQAELLKNMELFSEAFADNTQDSVTYATLTGMEARLADGTVYGRIIGVYNFGAGDVIEIELTNGGKEMLPFNDSFVGDIDVQERSVIFYPPEYVEVEKN